VHFEGLTGRVIREEPPNSAVTGINEFLTGLHLQHFEHWLLRRLCLRADHPTMAVLVWVMALAGSALLIAFPPSWRPRRLRLLVAWVRSGSGDR
jgi:hypothetical protein